MLYRRTIPMLMMLIFFFFFFFNDTATTEIYTLSLHDALPISGRYNLCPRVRFFATPPYDGAFAEYVVMPESFVFAIPDSLSDDAAGLLEPLSVGVWACRRASIGPGSRVMVTGAGPIGLISAQTARAF